MVYVGANAYYRTVLLFIDAQFFCKEEPYNSVFFIVRQLDSFQSFDTKNHVSSQYITWSSLPICGDISEGKSYMWIYWEK